MRPRSSSRPRSPPTWPRARRAGTAWCSTWRAWSTSAAWACACSCSPPSRPRRRAGTLAVAALQPVVREIFEISRFTWSSRSSPRCARRSPRSPPTALAAFERGLTARRARPLLGHARLDPGGHDLGRGPAQAGRRAGRRRRAAGSTPPSKARAFVEHELTFVGLAHLRRQLVLRADRDRRRRLRPLRPGQRRPGLRQPRARHRAGRPATGSTSSCPTCTGTTSWASRSSCPPTCPATASASTAATPSSRRRSAGSRRRRRFPVDFSRLGARDRVRAPRARARPTRSPGFRCGRKLQRHAGDSYGYRFEQQRQGRRLLDRLRAQAGRSGGDRARSWSSSATPTW